MHMGASRIGSDLIRVRNELAYELVRDEWELLLAIGSGPTRVEDAARSLSTDAATIARRVQLLEQHGLVVRIDGAGYQLVPAFYERQEGMSSCLRDLFLRRLLGESAPPVAGSARVGLGGAAALKALIARGDAEVLPQVVALANRPESDRSERFAVFFAAAECPEAGEGPVQPYDGRGFREQLLRILKAAATARSLDPRTESAYLWFAEMRTDPEIAGEIGELFERFIDEAQPSRHPHEAGHGAAVFAVLPASVHTQRPIEANTTAARGFMQGEV